MSDLKRRVITILEKNRGLVVVLFCLPASLLFGFFIKMWYCILSIASFTKGHNAKVRLIQAKVQCWNKLPHSERKLLCSARPNWQSLSTTFFPKQNYHQIAIPLYSILAFNSETRIVRVEPMVTVGQITNYLLPRGFALAVTLEIAEATLGGLALSAGMTTHSHRVGLYQETIQSYDVVLADGSLVTATRDNAYSDLFRALPWSHGSLCFLVALELTIIPVKKFIHMNYIPVKGRSQYCRMIQNLSGYLDKNKQTPDFLEATIFSEHEAVIMCGNFSDHLYNIPINSVSRWYKPWFFKHIERFLKIGEREELIPLKDYLFRHDRSLFWVVETILPFGNSCVFRFLLGWLLPPKVAFLKFTTTAGIRELTLTRQVFQDIILPIAELERQIEVSTELFQLFPLLVYPCRIYDYGDASGQLPRPHQKYLCPGTNYAMYNDLGIYGVPGQLKINAPYNTVEAVCKFEAFARSMRGVSFLYADIFMTPEEFNEMFNLRLYNNVRIKYGAEGSFPALYDKVKPEVNLLELRQINTSAMCSLKT